MRDPEKEYENAMDVMMEMKARDEDITDEDMTTEEAADVLRNAAWLGTYAERKQIEEAVEMAINALTAQEVSNDSPEVDNNFGELISRQAANYKICNACGMIDCDQMDKCKKVFTAQPEKCTETHSCDCISRQDAIDALDKHLRTTDVPVSYPGIISALTEWLNELPSALPEIIHCRDCKHWREGDAYSYCQKLFNCGVLDVYDYMRAEDDFCSMAERRTDESD